MKSAEKPINEKERQLALESYDVIGTSEEACYDQLTQLASQICGTKISLVSLIDKNRQWFKSHHGLEATETPRELAFCAHALFDRAVLHVPDSRKDHRFSDNPLVTGEPRVIFYAGAPLIDAQGFALGTLCVIHDKPKKLSKKQLKALEVLAEQVVVQFRLRRELKIKKDFQLQIAKLSEQVPAMVYQYRVYPDGKDSFPFVTEAIDKIYELTPEQVKQDGSLVFSRIHPDDVAAVKESFRKSKDDLSVCEQTYRVVLPQSGERWLSGFAKPEKLDDGSVQWYGCNKDVTEARLMESKMQQNAKLASLGEMASGIAHEINTPLSTILFRTGIMSELLSESPPDSEKILQEINKIDATTERIGKIVQGLQNFSRNAEGDPFVLRSLSSIVEDTLPLIEQKLIYEGVQLKVNVPTQVVLNCNSTQISQVLVNLLNNALDAVKEQAAKWICLEAQVVSDRVQIRVSDSGSRIPADTAAKIMNPFFTTKPPGIGTGLGLSVSRGLIEHHSGSLSYLPEEAHTTFEIDLPLAKIEPS